MIYPAGLQNFAEVRGSGCLYVDKTAIIHCPIGKKSFGKEKLVENYTALIDAIVKAKPAAAKGTYLKSVVLASTMGPGIKVVSKI